MGQVAMANVSRGVAAELQSTRRRFSTTQVRALNSTIREVIPAPPDGKFIALEKVVVTKPVGTAFGGIAAGEDLEFRYTDASGLEIMDIETTGFLSLAVHAVRIGAVAVADYIPVVGAAIILRNSGALTGGSPIYVQCFYRIVDAP